MSKQKIFSSTFKQILDEKMSQLYNNVHFQNNEMRSFAERIVRAEAKKEFDKQLENNKEHSR